MTEPTPINILREAGIDPASVRRMIGASVPDVTWSRWLHDDNRSGAHARALFRALCRALAAQRPPPA